MDKNVFLEWLNEYSDVMSYDDYIYHVGKSTAPLSTKFRDVCPRCHKPVNAIWKYYWEKTSKCYAYGANIPSSELNDHNKGQEEKE